ncbi:putative phosphotransferase enzyme family protein [Paratrimastix pyriformis]|uniref:Phosphotransferase enzyme family protein n=1 Tax=Paratrimastix pyriformis TaxID=342808 RepID=A0ABQ8US84_9EUKA|nr:putative phosphotransferase enzyme family protein [Paratrimastix pyriformis]
MQPEVSFILHQKRVAIEDAQAKIQERQQALLEILARPSVGRSAVSRLQSMSVDLDLFREIEGRIGSLDFEQNYSLLTHQLAARRDQDLYTLSQIRSVVTQEREGLEDALRSFSSRSPSGDERPDAQYLQPLRDESTRGPQLLVRLAKVECAALQGALEQLRRECSEGGQDSAAILRKLIALQDRTDDLLSQAGTYAGPSLPLPLGYQTPVATLKSLLGSLELVEQHVEGFRRVGQLLGRTTARTAPDAGPTAGPTTVLHRQEAEQLQSILHAVGLSAATRARGIASEALESADLQGSLSAPGSHRGAADEPANAAVVLLQRQLQTMRHKYRLLDVEFENYRANHVRQCPHCQQWQAKVGFVPLPPSDSRSRSCSCLAAPSIGLLMRTPHLFHRFWWWWVDLPDVATQGCSRRPLTASHSRSPGMRFVEVEMLTPIACGGWRLCAWVRVGATLTATHHQPTAALTASIASSSLLPAYIPPNPTSSSGMHPPGHTHTHHHPSHEDDAISHALLSTTPSSSPADGGDTDGADPGGGGGDDDRPPSPPMSPPCMLEPHDRVEVAPGVAALSTSRSGGAASPPSPPSSYRHSTADANSLLDDRSRFSFRHGLDDSRRRHSPGDDDRSDNQTGLQQSHRSQQSSLRQQQQQDEPSTSPTGTTGAGTQVMRHGPANTAPIYLVPTAPTPTTNITYAAITITTTISIPAPHATTAISNSSTIQLRLRGLPVLFSSLSRPPSPLTTATTATATATAIPAPGTSAYATRLRSQAGQTHPLLARPSKRPAGGPRATPSPSPSLSMSLLDSRACGGAPPPAAAARPPPPPHRPLAAGTHLPSTMMARTGTRLLPRLSARRATPSPSPAPALAAPSPSPTPSPRPRLGAALVQVGLLPPDQQCSLVPPRWDPDAEGRQHPKAAAPVPLRSILSSIRCVATLPWSPRGGIYHAATRVRHRPAPDSTDGEISVGGGDDDDEDAPTEVYWATGDLEGHIKLWAIEEGGTQAPDQVAMAPPGSITLRPPPPPPCPRDGTTVDMEQQRITLGPYHDRHSTPLSPRPIASSPFGYPGALSGHTDALTALQWHPGGRLLASGSEDGSVRVWDMDQGGTCSVTLPFGTAVKCVAWLPALGPSCLAVGSYRILVFLAGASIHLVDVEEGRVMSTLEGHAFNVSTCMAHRGRPMMATGGDDKCIKLWDLTSHECMCTLTGHGSWVCAVAFPEPCGPLAPPGAASTEGQTWVASGSQDRTVKVRQCHFTRLWDWSLKRPLHTLHVPKDAQYTVKFSPTGFLYTGGKDGLVRVWDPWHLERPLSTLPNRGTVYDVGVLPYQGKELLVVPGSNKAIDIWNVLPSEEQRISARGPPGPSPITVSDHLNGILVAATTENEVFVFRDSQSTRKPHRKDGRFRVDSPVVQVCMNPERPILAVVCQDGSWMIFDLLEGNRELLRTSQLPTGDRAVEVGWVGSDELLVRGYFGERFVYDLNCSPNLNIDPGYPPPGDDSTINTAAVLPDGWVEESAAAWTPELSRVRKPSKEIDARFRAAHGSPFTCACLSPDDSLMAVGYRGNHNNPEDVHRVVLYDVSRPECPELYVTPCGACPINVQFNPTHYHMLTLTEDGAIHILELERRSAICDFKPFRGDRTAHIGTDEAGLLIYMVSRLGAVRVLRMPQ